MHKNVMASMLGVVLFGALSNISWAEEQIDPNKTITRGEINNELIELARSLSQKGENYRNEVVRYVNGRVNDAANTTKNYINEQINAQNRSLASQRDAINTVKQDVTVSVGKVNKEQDEQKDVLRGEIGSAKRDAYARADSNAKAVRGELKQQGDSLRGESGSVKKDAYARIDSNTETVRGEFSQTSKYLSGKINANQSAVSKNSRRLDLHESWQ